MTMKGEIVVVQTRKQTGKDILGNSTWEPVSSEVDNVLVAPGVVDDIIDSTRPEGSEVHYTLYFPKSFSGDLENAEIIVRGELLKVVGRPAYFDLENCPTDWNMVVKVGTTHG